ncbi:LpqB family beta-propeller domain-containing protein [Demequina sp. SYSU T00039]|uniref:LpqB family beta-propeller domain-containing protein n=1 Tax=Demequina lignilytica TaxID=3051663 RepID=A0AAW7M928_9MICO|nr:MULTISPECIES: LpqB family beta-propeller domain-containing protein [unclassified Demequina]MDN4478280.1 LpqB family beta-propeller domain-containing protein [Demequina sp. SYSU T00039-1]MDN4488270.1 LpqB family beta-propeller domain-containing protein [Demequina sp. SYSU T00039]
MRLRLAAWAAVIAVVLAACATIPTSGPVNEGGGQVESVDPFVPFAEGPRVDDPVTAIVSGFIRATAAGFASDFSVAREYLTAEARASWDPLAQITVFDSGALTPDYDEAAGTVVYAVPVAARLDGAGRMVEAADGTQTQLKFTMAQDDEGQWRIAELDDGSLLAEANFTRLFQSVSLIFATPDQSAAVPELRWLPLTNVATWAARELVAGPSAWLAAGVATGFPAGSALAVDSVVVTDGVAAVGLTGESAGSADERALALAQLRLTLTALPGIRDVTASVGGVPLSAEEADLSRDPIADPLAAVIAGGRLGLWDGDALRVTAEDAGAVPDGADALALAYDDARVAYRIGGTRIVVSDALAGGVDSLQDYDADLATPTGSIAAEPVLEGNSLLAPSFDRFGWLWSAEASDPTRLIAVDGVGGVLRLDTQWLAGRVPVGLSVSRDGSRVLVVSRAGSQTVVEVAAVVRADGGEPVSVGEPLAVGANVREVADAIWVDDLTVGLLGTRSGDETVPLWLATVGGRTTEDSTVPDAVAISARHGDRSITLVSADGAVRERAGTGWAGIATGIQDLAYAG